MAILKTHRHRGYVVLTAPAERETDGWSPNDLRAFLQAVACRVGNVRTSGEASEALAYLNWRANKTSKHWQETAKCGAFVLKGGNRCHCDEFSGTWSVSS